MGYRKGEQGEQTGGEVIAQFLGQGIRIPFPSGG